MFQNPKIIIYFLTSFNALRMIVGAISSLYLLNHGMDLVMLGFLKSLQSIIFFCFDIPSSYLADKYSRKWAILAAIFLGSSWLILTGFGQTNLIFFIAEILNALSLTIFGGVFFAYIVDISQDQAATKSLFNKLNRLQFFLMAISALLGSLLYMINPKLPWLLSGTLCLILGVIGVYFLPESRIKKTNEKITPKTIATELKNSPKALILEGLNLAFLLALFQILLQYWQPIFQAFFPNLNQGLFFGIIFALILGIQSLFGHFATKLETIPFADQLTASLALIIPILTAFLAYNKQSLAFAILLILLFGVMQALIASTRGHYHLMLKANTRSIYESFSLTLSKLVVIILLPLIGYIAQNFSWNSLIALLPILALLNLYLSFKREKI